MAFNPEMLVFLDDDCYVEMPERLVQAVHLIYKKIANKEIFAVSGLYKELSLALSRNMYPYGRQTPTSILTGMRSFLHRSFLTQQEQRLVLMPYHALGGALILSKKVALSLPFDPFIPRGEDHAYCVDLKARCGEKYALVRDNFFVVQHRSTVRSRDLQEVNVLRDMFRFIYLRFKVKHAFIPYFTLRWGLTSLISMLLKPWNGKQYLRELWVLLFQARIFAKRNAHKFVSLPKAWKVFLRHLVAQPTNPVNEKHKL
jgi:hypothetical protein